MGVREITLALAALTTGVMAGLFFAYSFSVIPGLGKLSDSEYIRAMQSINREIQNPWFFACFFGALILLPAASYLTYGEKAFPFVAAAALAYAIGTFGVTVVANVPLNDALEAFDPVATPERYGEIRAVFESRWNFWNHVRTLCNAIALLLLLLGYLLRR